MLKYCFKMSTRPEARITLADTVAEHWGWAACVRGVQLPLKCLPRGRAEMTFEGEGQNDDAGGR